MEYDAKYWKDEMDLCVGVKQMVYNVVQLKYLKAGAYQMTCCAIRIMC